MALSIVFKHVTYSYSSVDKAALKALSDVSFKVRPGSFAMIVGKSGSGKSTLIQQINGILRPTSGCVQVGNITVKPKMSIKSIMSLRKEVGLVFQVAQDQLFGETVQDDLTFGPKNFKFEPSQIKKTVLNSAKAMNIPKRMLRKSPFDLSGGQMKRVAIASILACHPKILVLDEPTVGLDSLGRGRIMKLLDYLRKHYHLTIIMVTHQMDLVAKYATQVLVMKHGKLLSDTKPESLFRNPELLRRAGLSLPFEPRFAMELSRKGIKLKHFPLNSTQLAKLIMYALRTRRYRE